MNGIRRIRNAVFTITIAAWLWLCWSFWRHLVAEAADAGEIYARTPGYQALNFAIQYLWILLLLLAVALLVEWLLFRLVGASSDRRLSSAP